MTMSITRSIPLTNNYKIKY